MGNVRWAFPLSNISLVMLGLLVLSGVMVAQRTLNPQPSEGVSVGSNPTTPTIMNKELWIKLLKANIDEANAIYKLAKDCEMLNEQEFLDWQDSLNEISCK